MMIRLTHILSRYHPRYPRTLVYMLQASEYNVRDYLSWYRRTSNFSAVERRGRLVRTPKAIALLVSVWCIAFFFFALAGGLIFVYPGGVVGVIAGTALACALPRILAYATVAPLSFGRALIERRYERWVIASARRRLSLHPGVKLAVAGSFGKTTMRDILATVISEGKKVSSPPQSHNTPLSISRFIDTLAGDEEVLIFELGEYYPGDVAALCALVKPDIGVITGVNEAHIQRFGTLTNTAATIFELADFLGDKPLYVNGESAHAHASARPGHIVYTRAGAGAMSVTDARTDLDGLSFTLERDAKTLPVTSSLIGLHHVGALAAAIDIAFRLGLSSDEILRGAARTKPFPHRLEPRRDESGVVTIDDSYNGNPDGVGAAIDFLASLDGRRRLYVTPGLVEMGARSADVHREIGRCLASAGIERVLLIRNSVTPYIAEGLASGNYSGAVQWYEGMEEALAALAYLTVGGDVVLIQNDWPDQYA